MNSNLGSGYLGFLLSQEDGPTDVRSETKESKHVPLFLRFVILDLTRRDVGRVID